MQPLFEQYRPRTWEQLVGQEKIIARIDVLRRRGLAGRAYFLSGASGTGKTTIARLIAAEIADEWATEEIDAADCTPARLREIEQRIQSKPLGGRGWAFIVNECHGLRRDAIRQLLVMLERLPDFAAFIFTTTVEAMESLFEDSEDSHPLLSRCVQLPLARRDLAKAFAERAREIAVAEGLDGRPIEQYVRLLQTHKNNLRGALCAIESGAMMAD